MNARFFKKALRLAAERTKPEGRPARLYVFGSSSSEALDYVFGDSRRYRSCWASGWSARGLRKEENRGFVLQCLNKAQPHDIIFLHFGVADAIFNAAYRAEQGDFMDPEGFCQEAADGVGMLVADLKAAGFENVYSLCMGPPNPLRANYFRRTSKMHGLPVRYQARLLNRMNELVGAQVRQIDLTPQLADEHGVLRPEFRRDPPNHHADYTKTQSVIWEALREIPDLPPRQPVWHEKLYHKPKRGGVAKLIKEERFNGANLSRFAPERNPRLWGPEGRAEQNKQQNKTSENKRPENKRPGQKRRKAGKDLGE